MRAKFYAFDEKGEQIINLSPSDFELLENGNISKISKISCPEKLAPKSLSVVLTIDISCSMNEESEGIKKIDLAKSAAIALINALPDNGSECAITCFEDESYLYQDFTNNKIKLLNTLDYLFPNGGTNFNEALLYPYAGSLQITKNAKNQKVIVLITDGLSGYINMVDILNEAIDQDCAIFSINLSNNIQEQLLKLSILTNGIPYSNVTTEEQAEDIYKMVLQMAQDKASFCTIEWESKELCKNEKTSLELKLLKNGSSSKTDFQLPISKSAEIEFSPQTLRIIDPPINKSVSKKVILTAKNHLLNVSNIISSDPNFTLSPSKFTLKPNESIELTLTYIAKDSGNTFCKFNLINDLCEQSYYAVGGYKNKAPTNPTLKLLTPNGGETFIVGSDSLITWEGVSPNDTVRLDYSIDGGISWNIITNEASGLEYKWKNIPKIVSEKCFIKASQGNFPDNYNQSNPAPNILWQRTLGGSGNDIATSIIETIEGALLVLGYTNSSDGDIKVNYGGHDIWLTKLNPNNGSILWQKTIGGISEENAFKVIETLNAEIVVLGIKNNDIWVIKLNQNDGSIIWEKTFGGSRNDVAFSVIESIDGSIIVAGYTESSDGDVTGYKDDGDFWIVKINQTDGSIIWEKTLGGSKIDRAYSIIESKEGFLFVAGYTSSSDGDISGAKGNFDYWIVKLDTKDGSLIWQKTYGGSRHDLAYSIIESKDGSLIVAGGSSSDDGDISNWISSTDVWLLKINQTDGSIIWQKMYGGKHYDKVNTVIETKDGDFVILADTKSKDGDITENKGDWDYWVLKIDQNYGAKIWEKTLGGSSYDYSYSIVELFDGTLVVAGRTSSSNGDITEYKGGLNDIWVIKLLEPYLLQSDSSDFEFSIREPISQAIDINLGKLLVNDTKDTVVSQFISNVGTYPFTVDSIYFQGADANAFSLVSGIPEYNVEPSTSHFGEFRFTPNRVGLHTAEVVIITQSDTLTKSIIGVGIDRNIAVLENFIDFGQVRLGEFKDTLQSLTIKNIGTVPFTITETKHNYPNDIDFTTLAGSGSFAMQPDETREMELRFAPSDVGRTSGMLEFHYDGVGSPARIQLYGEGIKQGIIVVENIIDFGQVRLGEFKDTLQTLTIKNIGTVPFTVTETKHAYPDNTDFTTISGGGNFNLQPNETRPIKLRFTPSDVGRTSGMLEFHYDGFGSPAVIQLLGEGIENDANKEIPVATKLIKSISPNPADNNMMIILELIDKGRTELSLYDSNGDKVKEFFIEDINDPGEKILLVYVDEFAAGKYFVVLKTPTINENMSLIIY